MELVAAAVALGVAWHGSKWFFRVITPVSLIIVAAVVARYYEEREDDDGD